MTIIDLKSFLDTAIISWGRRKTIVANARKWIALMDDAPFDFIMNSSSLRRLDPSDPVRYDYALFGIGMYEGF
ncbi:MAG: DUF2400 family protein [Bacteroidales bacterium]|nr:DUF2400 family protein [Lentimicrobiaceae bacterium]MDD5694646.1 DUF2400 family protein [Bacteroidales bacterium]